MGRVGWPTRPPDGSWTPGQQQGDTHGEFLEASWAPSGQVCSGTAGEQAGAPRIWHSGLWSTAARPSGSRPAPARTGQILAAPPFTKEARSRRPWWPDAAPGLTCSSSQASFSELLVGRRRWVITGLLSDRVRVVAGAIVRGARAHAAHANATRTPCGRAALGASGAWVRHVRMYRHVALFALIVLAHVH